MDCTVRHNCKNVCIKKRLEGGGEGGGLRGEGAIPCALLLKTTKAPLE